MTTKTYKSYTIQIVGLSHHIFRPGEFHNGPQQSREDNLYAPGFAMSMAEAKRWINTDIQTGGICPAF